MKNFLCISIMSFMLNCSYDDNEIGFNAGTVIDFLAELLPYNKYLKTFLSENRKLYLQKENYEDFYINCEADITGHCMLDKVVNIMKVAGEIVSKKYQMKKNIILKSVICFTAPPSKLVKPVIEELLRQGHSRPQNGHIRIFRWNN